MNSKLSLLFIFSTLFFIALLVHFPMLNFGLTGDHLNAIYDGRGRYNIVSLNSLKNFISPYGTSAILGKVIDAIWGANPLPYFFIALLTKIIASFCVYVLSKHLFKSKLIAYLVSVSSLLLFAGIQGNAPGGTIYISLSLTCLGFLTLFKLYDDDLKKKSLSKSLIAVTLLILAFAITPTRMYGIIPMLFLSEFAALFLKKTTLKQVITRVTFFMISYMYFKNIGLIDSAGTASGVASSITSISFYKKAVNLPGQLIFMLAVYRQVFLPDIVVNLSAKLGYLLGFSAPFTYLVALIPGILLSCFLSIKTKISTFWPFISLCIHSALVLSIVLFLSKTITTTQIDVFLGGFIANILLSILLYLWINKNRLRISATVFFGTPLLYMIAAYLIYPLEPHETLSRYLTASSFFASILIGFILYIFRQSRLIRVSVFFVTLILIMFNAILVNRYYINAGEDGTYQSHITRVFTALNNEIGSRREKPRPVVYVKSDNFNFLSTTLTDRGYLRFSLENNHASEDAMPVFVTSYEDLKNIYKEQRIIKSKDINAVYGFEIKNKQVFSITSEVRYYLMKEAH